MIEDELQCRPYDPQVGALICARLRSGRLYFDRLDEHPDLPDWDVVAEWLLSSEAFSAAVDEAEKILTRLTAAEMLTIADEEIPETPGRAPTPADHNTRTRRPTGLPSS
jgi:hypothetical protein